MTALRRFGENIWIADGPHVHFMGGTLPTRMIVIKLGDGSLWVNSPVTVPHEVLDEVHAIGSVRYLVAPTPLHVWRLDEWHALYPQAQLWGPPKAPRSAHLAVAGLLGDDPPPAWAGDIDQMLFKGNLVIEEVEFFHKRSRTLIITDFIQNYPAQDRAFFRNLVKRIGGVLDGGVPIDIRLTFINRPLARRSLEKLLGWDFDSLIVAHGACVERNAKAFMRRAFHWLSR